MATLNLKKFDISNIGDDSVIVFIGKRRTGKSFLVRDLLYYHRDIPISTVISGTEAANKFYGNIFPSMFIHDEYTPLLIEKVLRRQKQIKKKMSSNECNDIESRAILILDDCLYDNSWIKDKNIRCLFMNGRHYNIMFMITMQYPLGIPPNLRTNIDYVFILRENNICNRRRIYENYASMFPTFDIFCTVMDQCTENYECLVIQINASSNKLQEQVFWYKASDHRDFTMGLQEFWEASEAAEQKMKMNEDDDDMIDLRNYGAKRKNTIDLNVNKC